MRPLSVSRVDIISFSSFVGIEKVPRALFSRQSNGQSIVKEENRQVKLQADDAVQRVGAV